MLLTVFMVGCSNGDSTWISSDGNAIYIDGKEAMITEFDGDKGSFEKEGSSYKITYKTCVDAIRECPENRQGVHEADLSSYKKANYFDAYIDSYSCMHTPLDAKLGTTVEAAYTTTDKSMAPISVVREDVYKTMTGLKFGPISSAIFDGCIKVKAENHSIIVRSTDITIPGVLSVGKGTKDFTQQVEINGVTCMKYSSNNFDFYQYNGNIIKATKGTDINNYIELLTIK